MKFGFVYVFSNPGLTAFKVGMTTRALYLRASELAREYGTVYPFEIASRHAVDDPAARGSSGASPPGQLPRAAFGTVHLLAG